MVARPYNKPYGTTYKKRKVGGRPFVAGRDRVGGYYGRFSGVRGELKFHDVDLNDAVVSGTGTVTASINLIPQGVTESERVGRKCTIKSVHWRYNLILPEQDAQATPENGDSIRIILFVDKQANGATAAVTDILETATIHSFKNLANQQRFVFLSDKLTSLNYNSLASDGAGVVSQSRFLVQYTMNKTCNLPIEFSGVTGAIGEIRSNNIGVLLISSSTIMKFDSKFRLRFSDQ